MATLAMPANAHKGSRYRSLRGKSVSEARKILDHAAKMGEEEDGNMGASAAPWTTSPTSNSLVTRPRTKSNVETAKLPNGDHEDYSVPPIPPLPAFQFKEHGAVGRPKAAVMPSHPVFGRPTSPSPLGKRQVARTASASPMLDSPSDRNVTADDAASRPSQSSEIKQTEESVTKEEAEHQCTEKRTSTPLASMLDVGGEKDVQKLQGAEKLDGLQAVAAQSTTSLSSYSTTIRTPAKSPILERFGLFYRGRRSNATMSPAPSVTASLNSRAHSMEPLMSPIVQLMTPPASPLTPARSLRDKNFVTVRYRGEFASIRITQSTDTVDMLRQAAELMKYPINTAASILYEYYAPLGLERRIRRYERLMDVTDAWGHSGQQNMLLIRHACGPDYDKDLDLSAVAAIQSPPTFTLQMYHHVRPGKWQKRWISLLRDGQMVASKKPSGTKATDRDCQRLCNLAHCDIYQPTSEPTMLADDGSALQSPRTTPVKALKPPKHFVFGVKHQQRPATYPDAANYVHFLCTDDPTTASQFHALVHTWRSWYIKERRQKRLAEAERNPPPQITPVRHKTKKSTSHVRVTPSHAVELSIDETPHIIGDTPSPMPLLDMERYLNKPIDEFGIDWKRISSMRGMLPPTPGADSGVSMTLTPSTAGKAAPALDDEDAIDTASPSEDRRKRLDKKRYPGTATTGDAAQEKEPGAPAIAVTDTDMPEAVEPPSPAKVEPAPWLPSASDHTAKIRAEQVRVERVDTQKQPQDPFSTPQRPATSSGAMRAPRRAAPAPPPLPTNMDRRALRCGSSNNNNKMDNELHDLLTSYHNARQWALSNGNGPPMRGSKYLDVPGRPGSSGSHLRSLTSAPSMPSLNSNKRTLLAAGHVPAVWRESVASSSSSHSRPSTSGGVERRQQVLRSRSGSSLRRGPGGTNGAAYHIDMRPEAMGAPPVPRMPAQYQGAKKMVGPGRGPSRGRDYSKAGQTAVSVEN